MGVVVAPATFRACSDSGATFQSSAALTSSVDLFCFCIKYDIKYNIKIEKIFNRNTENKRTENIFKVRINREKTHTDLTQQLSTNN